MKKILKKIGNILSISTIILFTSCEKDLYENAIIKSISPDNKKTFTFEYLYNNDARAIENEVINQIKNYQESRRIEDDSISYGTIKYDEVMKVVDNLGNKTFMLKVEHPGATYQKFYNMVLQEKINGSKYVKLFEYEMTPDFAEKYHNGLKEIKDFEGTFTYRLLAYDILDLNYFNDGEDGGGNNGSGGNDDGNTGSPTGNTGTLGSNLGSNNNSSGVGSLGSGDPCFQAGGPLSSGNSGTGTNSGSNGPGNSDSGGQGDESSSNCYIMVGNLHKVTTSSSCYFDITYLYVECSGNGNKGNYNDNNVKNRSLNDADPCNTNNNGVTIFEPSNATSIFNYQLNSLTGSTIAYNTFYALNPQVKSIVNNYIAQGAVNVNNAVTFFANLYNNNQITWFSQQPQTTQISILNYGISYGFSQESQVFINQMINYLTQNPNSSVEQYENWFSNTRSEGSDYGTFDETYWDNPNLTFPQQQLPSFDDFILSFPSHTDDSYRTPEQMFNSVGGMPLSIYNNNPELNGNTCALRVSRGLLYSGIIIPYLPNKTFLGDDGNYYFLSAANLLAWMKKTFGTPSGSNHLTGAQGGANGQNFPTLLGTKQGIYIMIPNITGGCATQTTPGAGFCASGHADLYFSEVCDGQCYFGATGGVKDIYFWELP